MAIRTDGERSKIRKWFARKLIAMARDMNLPSLRKMWEGFTFSAVNIDPELEIGSVTAPDGLIVTRSTETTLEVASADYWAGGFAPARPFNIPVTTQSTGSDVMWQSAVLADVVKDAYAPSIPVSTYAHGYVNEHAILVANGRIGNADMAGLFTSFYSSAGSELKTSYGYARMNEQLDGKYGFFNTSTFGTDAGLCFVACHITPDAFAAFESGGQEPYTSALVWNIWSDGIASYSMYLWPLFAHLHESIANPLSYHASLINEDPIITNSYAWRLDHTPGTYGVTMINLVFAEGINFPPTHDSTDYDLMLSIVNWKTGSGVLQYASQLQVFFGTGSTEATLVELRKYFGYPCFNFDLYTAKDSAMVVTDENTVVCWTRGDLIVGFSTTSGIFSLDRASTFPVPPGEFGVPLLVETSTGVRPNITKSTNTMYFCISEDTGAMNEVVGIHIGSPFASWLDLPMPLETLLHVRPMLNDGANVFALGIVSDGVDRFTAVLQYNVETSSGEWVKLAKLPFTPDATEIWGLGVYGNGGIARMQQSYLQPPHLYAGDFFLA